MTIKSGSTSRKQDGSGWDWATYDWPRLCAACRRCVRRARCQHSTGTGRIRRVGVVSLPVSLIAPGASSSAQQSPGLCAAGTFRNSILVLKLSYFLCLFCFSIVCFSAFIFLSTFLKILSQEAPLKVTEVIFRIIWSKKQSKSFSWVFLHSERFDNIDLFFLKSSRDTTPLSLNFSSL